MLIVVSAAETCFRKKPLNTGPRLVSLESDRLYARLESAGELKKKKSGIRSNPVEHVGDGSLPRICEI